MQYSLDLCSWSRHCFWYLFLGHRQCFVQFPRESQSRGTFQFLFVLVISTFIDSRPHPISSSRSPNCSFPTPHNPHSFVLPAIPSFPVAFFGVTKLNNPAILWIGAVTCIRSGWRAMRCARCILARGSFSFIFSSVASLIDLFMFSPLSFKFAVILVFGSRTWITVPRCRVHRGLGHSRP